MNNDIAIIGISGKYSKSDSTDELWSNLVQGKELNKTSSPCADDGKEGYINRCADLRDVEYFDNQFFGYSPYEITVMDPQHRLFLECCYRALENAGYANDNEKCIGVYGSTSISSYLLNNIMKNPKYYDGSLNYSVLLGNDKDFLSTRVSYKLNLTGPAITVQTACSSSLVGLHYACQGLLNCDCDAALVGGVSISIPQDRGYVHAEGAIFSEDGFCRPFDSSSTGTIKGDGCSVIMIKPLEIAEHDNDHIYAVIKGTAINNDGSNKIGYTAPSVSGQNAVIEDCMGFADLNADDIDYIESHGTGTHLGDPIEISALSNAYGNVKKPIPVGSVKANVGHLDCAAGMTGVIKSIYMLRNDLIPKNIHFKKMNPEINSAQSRFYFPVENEQKKLGNIAVSSFGLGGTNAHAIISKYQDVERTPKKLEKYLLNISFLRENDLLKIADLIQQCIDSSSNLQDFVYTMAVGRRRFKNNLSFVFSNFVDLHKQLIDAAERKQYTGKIEFPQFTLEEYKQFVNLFPIFNKYLDDTYDKMNGNQGEYQICQMAFQCFMEKLGAISSSQTINMNSNHDNNYLKDENWLDKFWNYLGKIAEQRNVDFELLYTGLNWGRIPVAGYPMFNKKFWIEPELGNAAKEESLQTGELHTVSELDYEKTLMQIWKEELELDEIDKDDDFFEIGGDSLIAINILSGINKVFDRTLTLNEMLDYTTPSMLAKKLSEENKNYISKKYVKKIRAAKSGSNNLFLMHPAGGTTFCYRTLMRYLDADMNIYAFDLPEYYQKLDTMEKLAKVYADQIIEIQADGEHYIGGYSFGGNLAYEVSSQMISMGKRVKNIYMVDSLPPEAYQKEDTAKSTYDSIFPYIIATYLNGDEKININLDNIAGQDITEVYDPLLEEAKHTLNLSEEEISSFYDKWIYNHRLLKYHHPEKKIYTDIIMFDGNEKMESFILNKLNISLTSKHEWSNYISGDLKIVPVNGDHFTVFSNRENIKYLSKKWEKFL